MLYVITFRFGMRNGNTPITPTRGCRGWLRIEHPRRFSRNPYCMRTVSVLSPYCLRGIRAYVRPSPLSADGIRSHPQPNFKSDCMLQLIGGYPCSCKSVLYTCSIRHRLYSLRTASATICTLSVLPPPPSAPSVLSHSMETSTYVVRREYGNARVDSTEVV